MTSGRFRFEIPADSRDLVAALEVSAHTAIRAAIRTSLSPARAHLKSMLNTAFMKADPKDEQSTGATFRAVTSKFGQSRTNRNYFYGIVGISRRTAEDHYLPSSPESKGKTTKRKQGIHSGLGLYAVRRQYRYNKNSKKSTIKTKQVFSRLKQIPILSRTSKARGFIRRVPQKYWHLLERGFKHRSGVRSIAYHFVERTVAATNQAVLDAFRIQLRASLAIAVIKKVRRFHDSA